MRKKKAIYNILSNLLLQIIIVIYGFIVPKVIITSFGSNVNGLISSITQFLAYITLLESGFGPVVKSLLYKPIAKQDNETIKKILKTSENFFRKIAKIFIMYIIVLCVFFPIIINDSFSPFFTISLIIIIAISTFAEYFFGMTYKLYLQSNQDNYIIYFIQIITYILSIIFVIVLVKINASIQFIKLVSGIIFILRPLLQNLYVRKKYSVDLRKVNEKIEIPQKWDGLAQHVAYVIHTNTDITVLTIFRTLSEVSVYSVYYLVINGVKSIISSFSGSIGSTFGDMIARNEIKNLNKKFNMYETLYLTIICIIFSCTLVLITPFIGIYTKGINDINYIRWTFGYLMVISEYIWAIMQPYSQTTLAAGHFKETKKGAWVEAFINLFISIVCVFKFGLNGVLFGTIIAVFIRMMEFIIHTNKKILYRDIWNSISKILMLAIETIIIYIVVERMPLLEYISYINWIINAFIIFITSSFIVFLINFIIFKKDILLAYNLLFKKVKKR